jgi:hypothetical protein
MRHSARRCLISALLTSTFLGLRRDKSRKVREDTMFFEAFARLFRYFGLIFSFPEPVFHQRDTAIASAAAERIGNVKREMV